jgi:hypothetical protein
MNNPYQIAAKEFLIELHETHLHQRGYNFEIEKAGVFYAVSILHVGEDRISYYDPRLYQKLNWDVTPGDRFRLNGREYEIKEEWSMANSEPEPEAASDPAPEPAHNTLPPANILSVGLRAVGIDCDIRTAQLTLDVLSELITDGGSVTIDRCIEIRERWEKENENE